MTLLGNDVVDHVIVPFATFVLGVVATLLLKKREEYRVRDQVAVAAIAKLTNDWYEQVHRLDVDAAHPARGFDADREIETYIFGRAILPALLGHRATLLGRKRYGGLLEELEGFLGLLTDFGETPDRTACRPLSGLGTASGRRPWELGEADKRVQRIAVLAARLNR